MDDPDVRAVQRAYPRVYHACHVEHVRPRTSPHGLSARDVLLLGHLDERLPATPADLARHMAVGASTLTAAVDRLVRRGYAVRRRGPRDRRTIEVLLTSAGAAARSACSVLDGDLLGRVLARLTPAERGRVVEGLRLLADAADAAVVEWQASRRGAVAALPSRAAAARDGRRARPRATRPVHRVREAR